MTSLVSENENNYYRKINILVKSPIKSMVCLYLHQNNTWEELIDEFLKVINKNELVCSKEKFIDNFYGDIMVNTVRKRLLFNDYKTYKLKDFGIHSFYDSKEIEFKGISKICPDIEGVRKLTILFNNLISKINRDTTEFFNTTEIIVSNNSFNVTDSVKKNIIQQWQPNFIDPDKKETIIILWDFAFFNPICEENKRQFYDFINVKEIKNEFQGKIRTFIKEKNESIKLIDSFSEEKNDYLKELENIIETKNLVKKRITWHVVNFTDTEKLSFNNIITKIFAENKLDPNQYIKFCYFCGVPYFINN
jgi:hypothetical protein